MIITPSTKPPSQRNLNKIASDKSGAVHRGWCVAWRSSFKCCMRFFDSGNVPDDVFNISFL